MKTVLSELKRNQQVLKSNLTQMKSYKKVDLPSELSTRVSGRLKKAKVLFDPSDFTVTKRQTEPSLPTKELPIKEITASSQQNVCCHCQETDDTLINCKGECETGIHLTCLQSMCERFGKDEELTWKCSSCQTCKIYNKNNIYDDTVLKCYICFSYYHVKCHGHEETMKIVKDNRFGCRICVPDKIQKLSSSNDVNNYLQERTRAFAQARPKPVNSENKFSNEFYGFRADELEQKQPSTSTEKRSSGSRENRSIDDDTDIPDATKWSVEQVFKYFHGKFPEYAHVLKYQEIDGPSLYLLKRSDVVEKFNINIGPALKMYEDILKLQTKCSDPTHHGDKMK